jgi:hypothetical protein
MPKPGSREANRLVIRFVMAKLKAATHLLRNRIRRIGTSRIARSELINAAMTMGWAGQDSRCNVRDVRKLTSTRTGTPYGCEKVRSADKSLVVGQREAFPVRVPNFRLADLHVSLCQGEKDSPEARFGGARTVEPCQNPQLARVPLGNGSCLRRTGHPFTVSDPWGSSQKIECVFSASPETIRREPLEFDVRRSVGNRRTWQSARCVILLFFARRTAVSKPPRSGNLRRV